MIGVLRSASVLFCWLGLTSAIALACSRPVCPEQHAGTSLNRVAATAAETKRPETERNAAPVALGSPPPTPPSPPEQACCPSEMAHIGRVCVDRWEAILVTRETDGRTTVHPHSERPEQGVRYEAQSVPRAFPQAYINRIEAQAACEHAGKRLCTLREWFTACRGPKRTAYPYGPSMRPGKCNSGKPHLLSQWFGADPRRWKYDEHFNDPLLDQEPGFLAKTGVYAACVNEYGVYDMVGNLHEWVSTSVDARVSADMPLKASIQRRLAKRAGNGIFLGGFFSTWKQHGEGCGFITIGHQANYHDYSTGFRCCTDARVPDHGPSDERLANSAAAGPLVR
jgi:sulfatase modifying factor 1